MTPPTYSNVSPAATARGEESPRRADAVPDPHAPPPIVIAMGGNSLLDPALTPTVSHQFEVTTRAVAPIAELIARGAHVVLTHGNGPQVGFIVRRSELGRSELHDVPLDSCDADTQGAIGYMIHPATLTLPGNLVAAVAGRAGTTITP